MESKIGVLYQDSIGRYWIYRHGNCTMHVPIPNLTETYSVLYDSMQAGGIERLWVFPDTELSNEVKREDFNNIDDWISWYTPRDMHYDNQPTTLRLRDRKGINRFIIFPAHQECATTAPGLKSQWELPAPEYLYWTVYYIEQELNMPLLWSGGRMGEEMLRRSHTSLKNAIHPLDTGLGYQWEQVQKSCMDRLVWKIPYLLPMDKNKMVGGDKNGQYLGASNGATLGNGNFLEATRFDPKSCGFWKYEITSVKDTPFNGKELPCPLDVNRKYASTALIKAAHDVGVQFDIEGGIMWPMNGRYLEHWSKECWQHRVEFRKPKSPDTISDRNAERSMKLYPNAMVGRFMNEYSKEYYHPDWQIGIIHQAIANQVYSLARWYKVFGIAPVLVNKDALYFVTQNVDAFLERTGLVQYSQELRGYKLIGICDITDEIRECFTAPLRKRNSLNINDIEGVIKRIMKNG
jgi:hypothetical protein